MGSRWLGKLFSFRSSQKSNRRKALSRRPLQPLLELLEARVVPTVFDWFPTAAGTYAWTDHNNWRVGGTTTASYPNSTADTANVNIDIAGNQTLNLNGTITVGTINLGDAAGSSTLL